MRNARLALVTYTGDTGGVIVPFVGADVAAHIRWMRLRGLSENTVRLRRTVLGLLVQHAGRPLLDLGRDDLDRWQDSIACLAAETRLAYVSGVRSYYHWAVGVEQILDRDPSAVLIVPKVARGLPRPIPERDLEWALANAPDPIRVWFELAGFGGLRAAEIAVLERPDIMNDADPPGMLVHGKGGRERVVPLAPRPLRTLEEFGMPWRGRLFAATARSVSERSNRWLHRHGIGDTLHAFRHRFATQLYESSGHDLVLVQQILGHASIKTTTVYTLVNARAGAAAVAAIDRPLLRPAQETGT